MRFLHHLKKKKKLKNMQQWEFVIIWWTKIKTCNDQIEFGNVENFSLFEERKKSKKCNEKSAPTIERFICKFTWYSNIYTSLENLWKYFFVIKSSQSNRAKIGAPLDVGSLPTAADIILEISLISILLHKYESTSDLKQNF